MKHIENVELSKNAANARAPRWTPEEDAVLRAQAGKTPLAGLAALLPGRSQWAVQARAQQMGLSLKGKTMARKRSARGHFAAAPEAKELEAAARRHVFARESAHSTQSTPTAVPYLDAPRDACRWPLWPAPETPLRDKMVCGARRAGDARRPYCAAHCQAAIAPQFRAEAA